MTILYSPNEPSSIKTLLDSKGGISTPYCEERGADFIVLTNQGGIPIQRKEFPNDFLASIKDGRLSKECAAMREASKFRILILEGDVWGSKAYSTDDHLLLNGESSNWTKTAIRNMLRTIRYVEGVDIEFTSSIEDTVDCLLETLRFFNAPYHSSLHNRPKPQSNWFIPLYEERLINFYQGLPRVSAVRARNISKIFKNPMGILNATVEDLKGVEGIGQKTAQAIYDFLRGGKAEDV